MSRVKKAFYNSISGLISLVLNVILAFVLSKVLISNLGLEYNGLNGLFSNIIAILSIVELGIAGAINYSLYKPVQSGDDQKTSQIMSYFRLIYQKIGLLVIFLSIFCAVFVPFLVKDSSLDHNQIRLLFGLFSISSIMSYFLAFPRNLLYVKQDSYIINYSDVLLKIIKTIIQIYFLTRHNFIGFLIINIIYSIIANLVIFGVAVKKYPEVKFNQHDISIKDKKIVFDSVKKLAIIQLASVSINFTDNIILSSFVGISSVGLFVNYSIIVTYLRKFSETIFANIGSSLGNLIAEGNQAKIKRAFYNMDYLGFIIGSFLFLGFYFLTENFIANIWLGANYLLSGSISLLLALILYINSVRYASIYYLKLSGQFNPVTKAIIIEAIINLAVSLLLVNEMGVQGVIIGTLISLIICTVHLGYYYAKQTATIQKYIVRNLLFGSILIFQIILIRLGQIITGTKQDLIGLFISGGLFGVIYISTIVIILKTNKKLDILRRVLKRFK